MTGHRAGPRLASAGRGGRPAVAAVALLGLLPLAADGAVLRVTDCGDTTPGGGPGQLRRLLNDAMVPGFGPTTILIPACTITLTGPPDTGDNTSGSLDIFPFAIHLKGAGAGRTVLDGGGVDRVLDLFPGANVVLDGVTVRGGVTPDKGGGIQVRNGATLELVEAEVVDNQAAGGGGIFSDRAALRVRDSTVARNRAQVAGGIFVDRTSSPAILERSLVHGNTATADAGGGIVALEATLLLIQSTVSGNEVPNGVGGGLINLAGSVTVLQSTITGNRAGPGGAGLFQPFLATLTVRSSIVAGNVPDDCSGPGVASAGFNLQSGTSCDFTQGTDLSSPDPGLGPLADNGGPTLTHLPRAGSPALDAGAEAGCPPLDQRDGPRPQPATAGEPARCDIGAVERRPDEGSGRGPALLKPTDPR